MRMRVSTSIVAVLALAAVSAQDWNQWRGPSRNGVAGAFTAPAQWPEKPTKVWQVTVGIGHSSPVVSGGRVFQHTRVGEQEQVSAFEIASGKRAWQQTYDAPYQINPAAQSHGKGPKSTPVVAGGRLFTFGISGTLTAFDAASGKVLWRKAGTTEFDGTSPDFGVAMSPMVDGTTVVAHIGGSTSGSLVALDAATGTVKWQWKGDGPAYASPVIATIGKTRQLITQSRLNVVALDAADGRLLWQIPFKTAYYQNIVSPVVDGERVIFSGAEHPLIAVTPVLSAGKWVTHRAWQNEDLMMYMNTPVLTRGMLFGLTYRNKGQFFAVDPATGKTLWTTRGREGENAALVAAGDVLLATTTEGELVVMRPDRAKFDQIKRYTIAESPIWAHPAPAGRGVLVKDDETLAYWTF